MNRSAHKPEDASVEMACCQATEKDAPFVESGEGSAPVVSVANGSLGLSASSITVGDQETSLIVPV